MTSIATIASGWTWRASAPGAGRVLAVAAFAAVASFAAMPLLPLDAATALDNAQQIAATVVAAAVIGGIAVSAAGERRAVAGGLLLALSLAGIGMAAWDTAPDGQISAAGPVDGVFVAAIAVLSLAMARSLFGGVGRQMLFPAVLDALIAVGAITTVSVATWGMAVDPSWSVNQDAMPLLGVIVAFSAPTTACLVLLRRRIRPSPRGVYAVVGGLALIGMAWTAWMALLARGNASAVSPTDFAYSAGVIALAWGMLTWGDAPAMSPRSGWMAGVAVDLFPPMAVTACLASSLISSASVVKVGVAAVVGLSLVRQAVLARHERRATAARHDSESRLAREKSDRAQALAALSRIDTSGTPEDAAKRICEEALRIDGVDNAVVRAFGGNGAALIMAAAGPTYTPGIVGSALSAQRSEHLAEMAPRGPWRETFGPSDDPHLSRLYEAGLRVTINAPLVWNERVIGVVGLGSTSASPPLGDERMATVREFGLVAGATIGPALAERARVEALREAVARTIESRAFHPVFQPVVDISTGAEIGFEALTRFDDGMRPDLRFADAHAAGMGVELEVACLRAALESAASLPQGAWLSLNASPALAMSDGLLASTIDGSDRELVLEVTEHAPIESYSALRQSLSGLRDRVRLAVDDAGSGYAGLQHILEIQPDIMKLDISLVRSADTDAGRRALIASMVAFARETGCTVLAEGIETQGEMDTMRALGVALGQGYLLGRPATAEAIGLRIASARQPETASVQRAAASC